VRRVVLVAVVILVPFIAGMVGSKASAQSDAVTAAVVGTGTAGTDCSPGGPSCSAWQFSGTLVGVSDTALYGTFNLDWTCSDFSCDASLSVTDNLGTISACGAGLITSGLPEVGTSLGNAPWTFDGTCNRGDNGQIFSGSVDVDDGVGVSLVSTLVGDLSFDQG
jgi:hypothetical protein